MSASENYASAYAAEVAEEVRNDPIGFLCSSIDVERHGCDVEVMRSYGGPTCWVSTKDKAVYCTYGDESGSADLSDDDCAAIMTMFS